MRCYWYRPAAIFLLSLGFASTSFAAPPTTTGLFPAGGQRGTTVEVTAIGTYDAWPTQVSTSSPLLKVKAGKEKGKLTVTIAADAPPGVYWLRCYDNEGAGQLRPFIVGELPEVTEVEPNDDLGKAQAISQNGVINGKLNKNGDVDCFRISLKKGQTLVASAMSHQVLRSAADLVMQLVTPTGTILTQNHDYHGLDPQLNYTASRDETVIVRLFAFPANPDSSIRFSGGELYIYRLTITTGGFADMALPLAVHAEKPVPVRLLGWNLTSAFSQAELLKDQDGAHAHHPQVAGLPPVRMERWPTFDSINAPTPLTYHAPCSVTAGLTADKPEFEAKVMMTKGKKLKLEVVSAGLNLDLDPVLSVRDVAGKQVHQAESAALHSDLVTSFSPAAEGMYTVQVRDLHRRVGARMSFLLRVFPEEPSYTLSLDADRFMLTPGKPLDIVVKVAREASFNQDIALAIEGLPKDVQVKTLSTSADKKVVTLRLETSQGQSAVFRIVGTTTSQPANKTYATATLPDLGISTTMLWLTVPKKLLHIPIRF